jgi:hypothetical protein
MSSQKTAERGWSVSLRRSDGVRPLLRCNGMAFLNAAAARSVVSVVQVLLIELPPSNCGVTGSWVSVSKVLPVDGHALDIVEPGMHCGVKDKLSIKRECGASGARKV